MDFKFDNFLPIRLFENLAKVSCFMVVYSTLKDMWCDSCYLIDNPCIGYQHCQTPRGELGGGTLPVQAHRYGHHRPNWHCHCLRRCASRWVCHGGVVTCEITGCSCMCVYVHVYFVESNEPPIVVFSKANLTVTNPVTSAIVNGSGSYDDYRIDSYWWTQDE